nr:reverse transcriptase domain-containing protein [Tanacetum cinerariifolium]
MQQKKYVKDPVEIHNIKQREGETLKDFMERFKIETGRIKGAPECMRIFGFMHGINNPELTKRPNEHVPKTMEEMMIATTAFIRGEAATVSKKKGHGTPKKILAAEANKFQPPPPMVTPIEELVRAQKLSHLIKEMKQGREQTKIGRKEAAAKDKPTTIYMVRSWQRTVKQKITQSFEQGKEITFPPLTTNDGTEGPLVIEAEMGGHTIHRMYIDGGSSMEILYEHCFNRLRPEIKSQMETSPISTKAWMNIMTVKSLSPYNGIIGRPGLKAIQAVPSTVHGMLKFPTKEGIVTIRGSLLIPAECTSIDTSSPIPREKKTRPNNLTVPLHPNFPDQEVVVGGSLFGKGRTDLCALLKKNLDIFAWQPSDMTGVPRSIAEHRLNIQEGCPPHGPDNRTGDGPDASLLYKPCITGSGTKLLTDGKIGFITGLCSKKTSKIFSGTSYHGEHNITYRPRTSIKGQILAHILNEMPSNASQGVSVAETQEEPWMVFIDGSSCVDGSGAGLILRNPDGVEFTYAPRNKKADALSKIASTSFAHLSKHVLVEVLETKSITGKEVTAVIEEEGPTWMTELVNYLKEGILPGDEKEARKIRLKARQYELMEGILYKRSFLTPWLRCMGPLQAEYVMKEIHKGSCSMHAGPRSVVAKAIRLGYFWPTMHKDAQDMIRKCSDCQIHRPITRHSQQPLTPIMAPWPFYKWGIDIAGPFPEGPGKVKFLIVAMDYFTKWIDAKAMATITGGQVKKFVWDNIVCRFGIPGEIISDNGKQFADNPFKDWCDKLNITQHFASVKHPQSNGLVKRVNRSLGEGIKARLGEGNENWVKELPHILWAHRTMIKSSHGDTPFSLTYETKAVIPAEIGMPTYHTTAVDVVNNDEELRLNLDLLKERRKLAAMSEARSKSKMIKYYNSRVRGVAFKPGDFIYRSNDASQASKMIKYYNSRVRGVAFKPGDFIYRSNDASHAVAGGKLGPKWEGPYE